MTSRRQISLFTEDESTLLPEGSHASRTAPQAKDWGKMTSDISGPICLDAFGRFPRVGSWARMFSALLIGQAGWYSTKCRLTWKLKGTKSNRLYFQLQASTLPTEGIESGLLPTATAQDFKRRGPNSKQQGLSNTENWTGMLLTPTSVMTDEPPEKMRERAERNGYKNGTQYGSLLSQVKYSGMLPTPVVQYGGIAKKEEIEGMNKVKNGKRVQGLNLQDLAINQMLPTPTTGADHKTQYQQGGRSLTNYMDFHGMLPTQSGLQNGKTSQLNPQFVEEMMGFPENWTASPFQSGETKA